MFLEISLIAKPGEKFTELRINMYKQPNLSMAISSVKSQGIQKKSGRLYKSAITP